MEIIQSIVIGIIQGITEFLPISSSAHLVLTPYLFGWDYKGLSFDVALHFGTVIAILVYFWKDWLQIIKSSIVIPGLTRNLKSEKIPDQVRDDSLISTIYPKNTLWQIIVATIPAVIVGFILSDYVEKYLHSPLLLAANLAIFGIVLWLVDKKAKVTTSIEEIKYKDSFKIGLAQALALIPGVSRSGITMITSRGIGLSRENAARFSFLLGTPAMLGALVLEGKKMSVNDLNLAFIFGVLASAVAGFLAIKFLLQFLKRSDFKFFALYRIILALIIVLFYFLNT